ncbi:hypothetical protein CFC21_093713 [Triticum aestivum]|uniref:Uncharacterized protein n=2 Tax=Triticum aestivum TaxID=4565 RepID=A0A341X3R4_WHEAT|nr:hypothetical protein CFC21_084511 [Triticum aestivum]KAF7080428.1 hypothetical protein CFC21_084513 [Triticum aestivum]KAF7085886.1 hypothetical protein CFC21_089257 [Triticum aestivum]KAF7091051.1 hypothetical protein CFC21_093713 [Triticum aestivum]
MVTSTLDARARTSAQETTPGHSSSRANLERTTASKASPGREWLISASFSDLAKRVGAISTEASQPVTKQSWKKTRSMPAAVVGFAICFDWTTSAMIRSARGHVWL